MKRETNRIMSVKRIIVVSLASLCLVAFGALVITDAIKTKDKLDFQEVQLKTKSIEIKQLDLEADKLNRELQKAKEDKNTSQEQLEKLNKEKEELEKKTKDLENQLQAKLDNAKNNAHVAAAQTSVPSGNCVDWAKQAGITNAIAHELISRENRGCDPCVYNNGTATGGRDCNYSGGRAYGIPQALPGNKMASAGADWRTNPVTQLKWMQSYVYGRYGSWEAAKAFHDRNGWY